MTDKEELITRAIQATSSTRDAVGYAIDAFQACAPAGELPSLPEPAAAYLRGCNVALREGELLFTSDQLQDYARAALSTGAAADDKQKEFEAWVSASGREHPVWSSDARDAARYRWLCEKSWFIDTVDHFLSIPEANSDEELTRVMDAAIDEAMKGQP